ncbi:MAG: IclR family transcriptional regulator [Alphaproteobacteria bacterium]|nr:IclR family transcriptional regulator [Alphaproteobacteria bacterium]MBU6471944.1 IclR family transcriptional regulator [Alphaproteobacteria bacterium]MDE2012136.1 IclR family transcriptional regulator [Alphaproteobacteria bacterium]MDE2072286.1 IclR family transcriptional regulator [Alphaproteobacteria bacterium]MDE2353281.1 IclR family transcriptional regulator [Alphaproteobacteria bacterium]
MTTNKDVQGAAARTVTLLQRIAENGPDFTLKELSERIQLPQSTVHRLLQVLVSSGMVERADEQAYRVGMEFFRIASLIHQKFDLQRVARPYLQSLWEQWRETCTFCLYKPASRTAMVAETIRSPHALQHSIEPFAELSLAWGSMGRVILAYLPDDDVDAVLDHAPRGSLSGRRAPSRNKMREELQTIRQRGYAVYEDHEFADVAGISAPLFGPNAQVIGCLSVTMPGSRFNPGKSGKLCDAVTTAARELSASLGFSGVAHA